MTGPSCPFRMVAYANEPAEQVCIQEECELWSYISVNVGNNEVTEEGCAFRIQAMKK